MNDLTLITGVSSNHFRCLRNLLYSLSRFESGTPIVVYDLGLDEAEVDELKLGGYAVRRFPFESYPPHVDIRVNRGQYAWKPVIVVEAMRAFGTVLWLDSGNLVHRRLDNVRKVLAHRGLYSPVSSGTIARWTHPGTLAYLRASPQLLSRPNRNGAIVGVAADFPGVTELAETWKACALDVRCIAPAGSDRSNHRQDQAVLSVLMYQFQERHGFVLTDERLDISTHNDRLSLEDVQRLLARSGAPAETRAIAGSGRDLSRV